MLVRGHRGAADQPAGLRRSSPSSRAAGRGSQRLEAREHTETRPSHCDARSKRPGSAHCQPSRTSPPVRLEGLQSASVRPGANWRARLEVSRETALSVGLRSRTPKHHTQGVLCHRPRTSTAGATGHMPGRNGGVCKPRGIPAAAVGDVPSAVPVPAYASAD